LNRLAKVHANELIETQTLRAAPQGARYFPNHADKAREQQLEKKKNATLFKNNPQEDMLFIQKEFRNFNLGTPCLTQKFRG
jgi:hypothetical protein